MTVPLGEGFHFRALGDIGGFGVGTDLSYQVLATLGVELSESCLLGVGWRHLGIDFDEEDLAMDVAFTGPLVGMSIAF